MLWLADPDMFERPFLLKHMCNMDLVRMILQAISEKCTEDGQEGFGSYATAMSAGRQLRETPPLDEGQCRQLKRWKFKSLDPCHAQELLKVTQVASQNSDPRSAALSGGGDSKACVASQDYASRILAWRACLDTKVDSPTPEQLSSFCKTWPVV